MVSTSKTRKRPWISGGRALDWGKYRLLCHHSAVTPELGSGHFFDQVSSLGPVRQARRFVTACSSVNLIAKRMSCVDGFCIARDFCDRDGLSVQSCVRPVCVAFATGPDEFRKRGSYRLNDLWGPRHSSECPCSWLTSFRIITSNVLHLWAGSSDRLPVFLSFCQKCPNDPG